MELKEVLNDLIEINNDRVAGFNNAQKNLETADIDLKALFESLSADSRENVIQLASAVGALGAQAETGTSGAGALHRAWIDVKATFTGHDRHSVLAECERGEDAIKSAYQKALGENNLPGDVRSLLLKQQDKVVAGHNKIKALRDVTAA